MEELMLDQSRPIRKKLEIFNRVAYISRMEQRFQYQIFIISNIF